MDFQQDEKGLFTFYRQQAEIEQQIKQQKNKRKLQNSKKYLAEKRLQIIQQNIRKKKTSFEKIIQLSKPKVKRKFYVEPSNKEQKLDKMSLGESVIVVNAKKKNKYQFQNQYLKKNRSKSTLGRKQQRVQYGGHFLQSKQLGLDLSQYTTPLYLGQSQKQKKVPIKYYNSQNIDQVNPLQKYNKLPSLAQNHRYSSEYVNSKKYKSKKIQIALKSDSSQIIKKIRQSLEQQSFTKLREQFSFQNFKRNKVKEQVYQPLLNGKQKRLIDILKSHKK